MPHPISEAGSTWQAIKRFDDRRPSMPGEHLATFGAGLAMLRRIRGGRSGIGKAFALVAGVALIWRAVSGRDGLARFTRRGGTR